MSAVKEDIEILKKAQALDREIYASQQNLKEIPQETANLKRQFELEKMRLAELEGAFKKTQLLQKQKEGELAQKEANVKKFDSQLGQVKTNKEYAALQQEIASLKADNSLLEEEIIRLLDEVEAADEEVKRERERLKQIDKEFQTREIELHEKEKVLTLNLEELKKGREDIMAKAPVETRNLYDLIVQKKQGLGLVQIHGEICGACQLQLRPQLINEVRLGHSLIVCENCSRILYFEE